jgi:tetratricopeptide (TPR) repeat protein
MDVPYRLARVNLTLGHPTRALAYIEQSLSKQTDEAGYALKARILQELGRKDEALAAYLELIKLNPDDAEAQYELNKSLAKW